MKISKPQILQQGHETVFRVGVEFAGGSETLWYRLSQAFGDLVSESCDAAVVALLIPAMAKGEDICVAGAISERLFYNLSGPYQALLQQVIPSLRRVEIRPTEVQPRANHEAGVATGFSGGIDSYCALADHYYSDAREALKVTHLLFNNVGSHGKDGERLFRERYARLEPAAERTGLPFVMIDSNVDTFYGKGLDFQQTHTPRNASVALLLQGGIGRYLYASTFSFADVFVGATYDMAYSDTVALPLLSTEALDAFSVGSEYTRVEKTLRVANFSDSGSRLEVCVDADQAGSHANCSTCWKCMRTLLTLEIAGMLERYSSSFNLDAYERRRSQYIGKVLMSNDPLLREVVRFAKSRHYAFPLRAHLYGRLHYAAGAARRVSRSAILTGRKLKSIFRGRVDGIE